MIKLRTYLSILTISVFSCQTNLSNQVDKNEPLFTKDSSNVNERNNTLFVFVGEKISISEIPYRPGDFDIGIIAKYKVIERVYGNFDKDIIEFEAYDHYGIFAFTEYKNALLFISEHNGKYYQEKYLYDPVFWTKSGRWAGPYSSDYDHSYNEGTTIKPEIIDFEENVSFSTKSMDDDGNILEISFPEPYYRIVGDSAIIIYGNYIEDLFRLKKEGVLTARKLF